jgi:hypothetical protein
VKYGGFDKNRRLYVVLYLLFAVFPVGKCGVSAFRARSRGAVWPAICAAIAPSDIKSDAQPYKSDN